MATLSIIYTGTIQTDASKNITSVRHQLDTDEDGLLDTWEQFGIDVNGDGLFDLDLPSLGADPFRKNIFVEIDYMQNHEPNPIALEYVTESFFYSPVSNPDGSNGVDLVLIPDEEIPEQRFIGTQDLYYLKNNNLGSPEDRSDPNYENIREAKKLSFHYALFAHQQSGRHSTSSGQSPGIPGMEFMITLGAPKWGQDPITGHNVGSMEQQAGTFMHELGHNLGLDHGGSDDINCKPNYLSVMSWSRQVSSLIGDQVLDYSWVNLDNLTEISLDETKGIEDTIPSDLKTVYGPDPIEIINVGQPIDWNRDGNIENSVEEDINYIRSEDCPQVRGQILYGFDDWSNLRYLEPSRMSLLIDNNITNFLYPTYSHSDIGIDDVIEHRLLLWDSIRNGILPINYNLNSTSDLNKNQTFNVMESILNDSEGNVTDLLVNNNLDEAITLLQELSQNQDVLPMVNKEKLDNLILVLEKQK
ncbi:MAG TPA: hypothetical protein VD815_06405 [Candidatus Saccharimonadales bacterium]|nr:hypothetical protein [Candidatus Saccharimonadales bacterium]